MKLVRMGDERKKPNLHLVYHAAHAVEDRLAAADGTTLDGAAAEILASFREYKGHFCTDFVMAASLVDSKAWAKGELVNEPICKTKLFEYISVFADQYGEADGFSAKAEEEAMAYLNKEGILASPAVLRDATSMTSHRFFEKYEGHFPNFARVALCVSVSTCAQGS